MNKESVFLKHFIEGNEIGLKHFMKMFGKPVRFYAYSLIKNKDAAEEIVSDSFFKLWNGREKIETINNIKAFLYIATKNACYDFLSSPKNKTKFEAIELDDLHTPSPNILAKIIYTEFIQLLIVEVEKLPEMQAKIFKMSFIEGYDTQEICRQLNTTNNMVYFSRSKAINILKEKFKNHHFILNFLIICSKIN